MHPVIFEDLTRIISAPLPWERLRHKTVLITGANGFLPAYMVETLLFLNDHKKTNCHILCLVRNSAKARDRFAQYLERSDLSFVVGDVSNPIIVPKRCDFIIHAASQASPKYYETDPVGTMTANIMGAHHLLNLAKEWKSEGFLFFSSGEIYGHAQTDDNLLRENDYGFIEILNTRSCYAESKRAAETLAVSYCKQFGVPCVIVRPFHTYGPGMALNDGRVFADFVRDIVLRRNIELHSDGKAVRAFCYLSDAVLGYFTVMLTGESGRAYNVGNPGGAMSIAELAEMLVAMYPQFHLQVRYLGTAAKDSVSGAAAMTIPSINAIAKLGWSPDINPVKGFERTIRYYDTFKDSINC